MEYQWNPQLSVGDLTIDMQHNSLLERIDELHTAVQEGRGKKHLEEVVRFLGVYVTTHLRYEEEYLENHGYPELVEHIALHKEFEDNYEKLREDLETLGASSSLVVTVQQFLGDWIVDHMKEADGKYYDYISSHPKSHPGGEADDYHTTLQE
ncbi:bacteriohemerythrin [Patescibacteria group bacterium]